MPTVTNTPGIKTPSTYINDVMALVKAKNPAEPEFHQAVQEVLESLRLVLERHPEYISARILERITELSGSIQLRERRVCALFRQSLLLPGPFG